METVILLIVIIFLLAFITYQDISNRRERENLELKLMSKDVVEYKEVTEKPEKTKTPDPDPYVPLEDVSVNKLVQAEDKL
jgi:flagellar biosynthesis/type III secretory pathway M-ring protein FliF/YscJ